MLPGIKKLDEVYAANPSLMVKVIRADGDDEDCDADVGHDNGDNLKVSMPKSTSKVLMS